MNYNQDYQDRPARKQAAFTKTQNVDTTGMFNIWYSKWSRDGKRHDGPEKAEYRCVLERDAGKTKATSNSRFCIHFAHGRCSKGHHCHYLHRIPIPTDHFETTRDIFGREKHRAPRADMSGVGSFENPNSSLYISGVDIGGDMERITKKHFSEWGEIDYVSSIPAKGVVFVKYVYVANAEFAKEAMKHQSLDHGEVIEVRWATEDPNPKSQVDRKRKAEENVVKAVLSKLPKAEPEYTKEDEQAYFDYYASHGYHFKDGEWVYQAPVGDDSSSSNYAVKKNHLPLIDGYASD